MRTQGARAQALLHSLSNKKRNRLRPFFNELGQQAHSITGLVSLQGIFARRGYDQRFRQGEARPEPIEGDENRARVVWYLQDSFSFSRSVFFALPFGQTVL